jgi:hypothetical protein
VSSQAIASSGPSPVPSVSPSPEAAAAPAATRAPVPLPSMKPTEVITWVKFERPRLALGEIVVGSFALAGLVVLISMVAGLVIGHFKSKRTGTHGAGGLKLR